MGNLRGEIDTVDEDVTVGDLFVWTRLRGRFLDIPPKDILIRHTSTSEGIHGTTATTAQGPNDDYTREAAGLCLALCERLLHICNQSVFVRV